MIMDGPTHGETSLIMLNARLNNLALALAQTNDLLKRVIIAMGAQSEAVTKIFEAVRPVCQTEPQTDREIGMPATGPRA
jgi:hypothetical protein